MPYLRRLSALGLILSAFIGVVLPLASAQTVREFQLSASAGDSAAPRVDQSFVSVTQLPQELNGSSGNGEAGYTATRAASTRLQRAGLASADGLSFFADAEATFSDNRASRIPGLGVTLGTGPSASATARIQNERITFSPPAGQSSMRVRIHGSLQSDASGLLGTNRPWTARGNTFFNLSATVRRQNNDALQASASTGTTLRHNATLDTGGSTTTVEGYWGQGTGTGAWNGNANTGEGYVELSVTGSDYLQLTVELNTNASVAGFAREFLIDSAALAKFKTVGTGRVWITLPDGGTARSTLGGLTTRNQTLTLPPIPSQTVDSSPVTLGAIASSGLPVTYTVLSGPATIEGSTLTFTGQRGDGYVEVRATQAGDDEFAPAIVTQIITLTGRAQTIDFPELAARAANAAAFAPGATASSGLPVTYTVVSGPATTDGSVVTLTGATGTVRLRATQPGGGAYEAAPAVERTFAVTAATTTPLAQTITFPSLLAAEVGVGQLLIATATSGLPVVYEIVAGDATLGGPNANILIARSAGLITVRATQPGGTVDGTTYAAAPAVERSFTATAVTAPELIGQTLTNFNPPAEVTFTDTPLELAIYPEASSGLPVTLSVVSGPAEIAPVSGAVRITGPGTVVLRAAQAGDATYAAVSAERTILVRDAAAPVDQMIRTTGFPLNLTVGVAVELASPTSTSGLPVSLALVSTYPAGIATLSGQNLTTSAPGFVTLRLTQAGGTRQGITYKAAEPVEITLPVLPRAMRALDLHGAWAPAVAEEGVTLALVFAADGHYYHGETGTDDPNGQDGLETGAYTWNTVDGTLNATADLDLNGEWGLSHPSAPLQLLVNGDTLIGREGDDYFTLSRVRAATPAIVGAWRVPVEGGDAVIVFFPNGDYLHLETATTDEAGQPGLEIGSYTWTAATGRLVATPTLDQNGEWGLSHSAADLTARLTGNQLVVREGGASLATLARVGTATAPKSQTITFNRPAARTFGSAPFALVASASSRLPVSFTVVSGSATLGTDGRTLTLTGAGEVVLRATQDGDATFAPADPVERTLVVNRAAQRITFAQPSPVAYGNEPVSLIATATSGLPVNFELLPANPAGSAYHDPESGTLSAQSPGRVTVRATQPGDANFAPAVAVSRIVEIRPAPPEAPLFSAGDSLYVGGQPLRSLATSQPAPAAGLRYFAAGLPAGLTLNATTGTLSGTITARPGNYNVRLWTQAGAIKSETRTLTLTVEAFPARFTGGHEWLLLETAQPRLPWGKLQVLVAANGTFTGTLLTSDAAARIVRGRLTPSGDGTLAQTALATPAGTLALTLAAEETPMVEVINGDAIVASADRYLRPRIASDGNAAWAGRYTLGLGAFTRVDASDTAAIPSGSGHATATIAANGLLRITGTLADGTPLTLSLGSGGGSAYDASPYFLWFARPHRAGANYLAGWSSLTRDSSTTPARYDLANASDHHEVYWKKSPQTSAGAFVAGFAPLKVLVRMQAWLPINTANPLAARLGGGAPLTLAPALTIDGMDSTAPYEADGLPPSVLLGTNNRFTLPSDAPSANARAWKLSADLTSGILTGTFRLPGDPTTSAASRTVTFKGVLMQPGANTYDDLAATSFLVAPTSRGGTTRSGELYLWRANSTSSFTSTDGTLIVSEFNSLSAGSISTVSIGPTTTLVPISIGGILTLSGSNTYTGSTALDAGPLVSTLPSTQGLILSTGTLLLSNP